MSLHRIGSRMSDRVGLATLRAVNSLRRELREARLAASFGATAASRAAGIELPEMIDLGSYRIMKNEVTVGLFKQAMKGYKITGYKADKLKAILDNPNKESDALVFVSLNDAREFAKRLSGLTGREFRVQTETEWLQAKDKLSGDNWTWTEQKNDEQAYVLRRLSDDYRNGGDPDFRCYSYAVRLVEDK